MTTYTYIAYSSWLILILVWLPGYFVNKHTIKRPNRVSRLVAYVLIIIGWALFFSHTQCSLHGFGECTLAGIRVTPRTALFGAVGLALDLVSIAFAIWARIMLGGNWANMIALKENHKLIQGGPYAIVRHPIYTGFIFGMLGTALTIGLLTSYLGVLLNLGGVLIRIHDEEALMAHEFGQVHTAWRTRTKKFIPFIW